MSINYLMLIESSYIPPQNAFRTRKLYLVFSHSRKNRDSHDLRKILTKYTVSVQMRSASSTCYPGAELLVEARRLGNGKDNQDKQGEQQELPKFL